MMGRHGRKKKNGNEVPKSANSDEKNTMETNGNLKYKTNVEDKRDKRMKLQVNDGDVSNRLNTVGKESTATGSEKSIESITEEIVQRYLDKIGKHESQSQAGGPNLNLASTATDFEKSIGSTAHEIIEHSHDQIWKHESQPRAPNANLPLTATGLEKSIESIAHIIIERSHDQIRKHESQSQPREPNVNLPLSANDKSIELFIERVVKQKIAEYNGNNEFVCPYPGNCVCCRHWSNTTGRGSYRGQRGGQRDNRRGYRGHWQSRGNSWYQ